MKNTLTFILNATGVILIVDALCFFMWIMLGQYPATEIYFGVITKNIITLFI